LAEREPELSDRPLNRHISRSQKLAYEWMSPHKEKMETKHSEAEVIVIRSPDKSAERSPLKLGWREMADTYVASLRLASLCDLEGVTVNKPALCLRRHDDVPLIDVANDMPLTVHRRKRLSEIARRMNKKGPIG